MSEDDRRIGTLVADRYRVGRKLGEGGVGVVYMAVHEALHKQVALKVLGTTRGLDREAIARFEREAIAMANLRHPNIAEATDFGQLPDGGLYLVMEYVEGTTLRKLVAEQGKVPPERALVILQQVAAALATAHAHDVVHRDLKPENVIVTSVPESGRSRATDVVKVIDFGIAKLRSATFGGGGTGLMSEGTVFGTPEYMAPEQVMGQEVDARADQYALGVIAFELFTGKPPYTADDVGQLMMMHDGAPVPSTREQTPALSPEIDAVVMKMLAKLPEERFASVTEAMEALAPALSMPSAPPALATRARPMPSSADVSGRFTPPPGGVPHRRWPVLAIGLGAASLVVGMGVVALVAPPRGEPTALSPELTAALADWSHGKLEPAAATIGSAITASPKLAELEAVAEPLAASIADDAARRALATLLDTTALGSSPGMASALADVAVADGPDARDGAVRLLRSRQALLSNEKAARVRLRDAETCDAFELAKTQEHEAATSATKRDLERLGLGECKAILRVSQLCEMCASSGPVVEKARPRATSAPVPAAAAKGKGKGKGTGKK